MRIVIDMQGAQAENKHRGIGRYSLSLAKAIVQNNTDHEIFLALNGQFPDTIESIRSIFGALISQNNIHVWYFSTPTNNLDGENTWRRKTAELTREAFLHSLNPDIVLITSIFEGLTDDAVTSIGIANSTLPTAVILYDLIPLIYQKSYLKNPLVEIWYNQKIKHLKNADLLLTISESSRQESIHYLNFLPSQSVNISAAADSQFLQNKVDEKNENKIRQRYRLTKPFVMYTGGIDPRKNIEGLIRAYAKLDKSLRFNFQLAIICSVQTANRISLENLVESCGLSKSEVVFTGYVDEEDLIQLYNLCEVFTFPSWHEGFGLPVLEAMCCGCAVIGSNNSSLPEVINYSDALFDPHNDESIYRKLHQVLTDKKFHRELKQHSLIQAKKFSWEKSAKAALSAIENWKSQNQALFINTFPVIHRPKLAFVSPLPPERSGISEYSSMLLRELACYYDIDVIVNQDSISDAWIRANCSVKNSEWLKLHADKYDRVLYHFGNSPFHQHMFDLLDKVPGIVVLHDFFLGHVTEYIGAISGSENTWPSTLYEEYGYPALKDRFSENIDAVAWKYPSNLRVLQNAINIIVHSQSSVRLAKDWHGLQASNQWAVIPLMRTPAPNFRRTDAREMLSITKEAFVVCSFGLLGKNKNNHELLISWLSSSLAQNKNSLLIFVGENSNDEYGITLQSIIDDSGLKNQIFITGWIETTEFNSYLQATDIAVQLRNRSRGETSAAVLDCMNYGIATIVNAHGSMADLSDESVWIIPDEFDNSQLIEALETLFVNRELRLKIGKKAVEVIKSQHAPKICAQQYRLSIEKSYLSPTANINAIFRLITKTDSEIIDSAQWLKVANSWALSIPKKISTAQLLVDISELAQRDSKTGIQRVVRSILLEMLTNPPDGYRVEPVYAIPGKGYFYARRFTLTFLNHPDRFLVDEPIEINNGDLFLGLDLQHHVVIENHHFYQKMRNHGVTVNFIIYDLIPVLLPHVFVPGAAEMHSKWLSILGRCDGVVCISLAVAREMVEWLSVYGPKRLSSLKIGYFHLGADLNTSKPTKGLPLDSELVLEKLSSNPTFLVVGTVEPRKCQAQVLQAFETLWAQKLDINLVFIGKQGWMVEKLVDLIKNHPELNQRLFWLAGISDEYLEKVYKASTCLIAASEGEGFGLPLIEAAQHKLPIIARDIPVFREIAGGHAFFFSGFGPNALACCVRDWLALDKTGQAPRSDTIPWLTWEQSTQNLLNVVLHSQWYQEWMPDNVRRFWGSDIRMGTQVGRCIGRNVVSTGQSGYLMFGPYIPLDAGQYWVVIRGALGENGLAGARMDVVIDKGGVILGESVLSTPGENGNFVALLISLEKPCTDLEVRVWVGKSTDLHVSMIEISPSQGEPDTSTINSEDLVRGGSPDRDAVSIEPAAQLRSGQFL